MTMLRQTEVPKRQQTLWSVGSTKMTHREDLTSMRENLYTFLFFPFARNKRIEGKNGEDGIFISSLILVNDIHLGV